CVTLLVAPLRCCFNRPAATDTHALSLHDALPICAVDRVEEPALVAIPERASEAGELVRRGWQQVRLDARAPLNPVLGAAQAEIGDRKSTRLNSSHVKISYAVFCLKKKNESRDRGR